MKQSELRGGWSLRWRVRAAVPTDRGVPPGELLVCFGLYRGEERSACRISDLFTAHQLRRRLGRQPAPPLIERALAQLSTAGDGEDASGDGPASEALLAILDLEAPRDWPDSTSRLADGVGDHDRRG